MNASAFVINNTYPFEETKWIPLCVQGEFSCAWAPHDCFHQAFLLCAMRCKPGGLHLISIACLHTYLITCLHKKHNLRTIITLLTYTCPTKERWGFESSLSLFCFLLILVSLSLSLIEKSLLAETISSMVGIIVLWPLILFISKRSMNENHMSTKAALSGPLHT